MGHTVILGSEQPGGVRIDNQGGSLREANYSKSYSTQKISEKHRTPPPPKKKHSKKPRTPPKKNKKTPKEQKIGEKFAFPPSAAII